MSSFVLITEENFTEEVLQSKTPILLEFGGEWCRPCKSLEPILLELGKKWGDAVRLAKLDVVDCPVLTDRFHVRTLPTTLLFIKGEIAATIYGLPQRERIREEIETHL